MLIQACHNKAVGDRVILHSWCICRAIRSRCLCRSVWSSFGVVTSTRLHLADSVVARASYKRDDCAEARLELSRRVVMLLKYLSCASLCLAALCSYLEYCTLPHSQAESISRHPSKHPSDCEARTEAVSEKLEFLTVPSYFKPCVVRC